VTETKIMNLETEMRANPALDVPLCEINTEEEVMDAVSSYLARSEELAVKWDSLWAALNALDQLFIAA
jgi:hypothetical protein